jgi:PAS domain-containing protein
MASFLSVSNFIGATVRHSLEALGPVAICDDEHVLAFANQAMRALRGWDDEMIGKSIWTTCAPDTRREVEPHWRRDPPDQVLYVPEGHAFNGDGTMELDASAGMWMPYDDGVNVGQVRVSAVLPLSDRPTERFLRNSLGVAVQAVQLGQLRMAYAETVHATRGAREVFSDIRLRLAHALRGLDGNPEDELYELRQLVADLSVILGHTTPGDDRPTAYDA